MSAYIDTATAGRLIDEHAAAVQDHAVAALEKLAAERGRQHGAYDIAAAVTREQRAATRHLLTAALEFGDLDVIVRSEIERYRRSAELSRAAAAEQQDEQQERAA